ncbi:MAG TPA: hypothetical protein VHP14_11040, partial [Anaerolineales bacterium]|nr:hypothetical protein [Anaerolineales bacterium]
MKTKALLFIAEDDPDDQYFLQEAIKVVCPTEVETHMVWDGAQLINLLRREIEGVPRKNLVVLDLNMRVKDGRTTLREIKSDPALADIPVVILSTSSCAVDIAYCEQYGV